MADYEEIVKTPGKKPGKEDDRAKNLMLNFAYVFDYVENLLHFLFKCRFLVLYSAKILAYSLIIMSIASNRYSRSVS